MRLTSIATVSVGCLLLASLVLTHNYHRRHFRKFIFSKAARPSYNYHGRKGSNFGAYRAMSSYRRTPGIPKVAYPYNDQPGNIGSKTDYNKYNDNRKGNYPFSVQVNKEGNTDLYKGPYSVSQGTHIVAGAYKTNQPNNTERIKNSKEYNQYNNQANNGGNSELYKGSFDVNQRTRIVAGAFKNQPSDTENIKNSQKYNQFKNQANNGGNTDLYTGVQGGLTVAAPYKNQPGYTENIKNNQDYNQYKNQANNGGNSDLYTGPDGVQGGLTVAGPYNNQPGYTGSDSYTKNSPENNHYSNQDNKGSKAGVYDGNEVRPQVLYSNNN